MHLRIPRNVLYDAIVRASSILASKPELEAYAKYRLQLGPKELVLSAYNSKMSVHLHTSEVQSLENGVIGVSAKLFKDIVKLLPEGEVTIHSSPSGVKIECGSSFFRLGAVIEDAFPGLKDYGRVNFSPIDLPKFLDAVSSVAFCMGGEETNSNPVFGGVYMDEEHLTATNGFQLAIRQNTFFKPVQPMIVPRDAIESFPVLFNKMDKGAIGSDAGEVHLCSGGIFVSSRLLAGEYPHYRSVLPTGTAHTVLFDKSQLASSLSRIALMTEGRHSPAAFHFVNNEVVISAKGQLGEAIERVQCGNPITGRIVLGAKLIAKTLSYLEQEKAAMEYRGADQPLIFKEDGYVNLVLPQHEGQ